MTPDDPTPSAAAEWRDNWTVVLAGAAATTLPVVHLYSVGVMLPSLERQFGWTRAQISSGPALASVLLVIFMPIVGLAIDRVGPRRIGLVGAVTFCVFLALLGSVSANLWHWWLLWILLSIGASLVSPAVWTAGVSSLFVTSRGLAIAITLTGTGLGAILVPSVTTALTSAFGWRGGYFALGAIWLLLTFPLLLLFFASAADRRRRSGMVHRGEPTIPLGPIMRSPSFLKLATAATVVTLASNAVVINIVPILRASALTPAAAAGIAALIGIGSIIGRLTGGLLLDRMNASWVGAGAALLLAAGIGLLFAWPGGAATTPVAVFLLGLSVGVEYDAVAYLTSRHFGLARFGALFGTITGLAALTGGAGPLLTSIIYDRSGSYALTPILLVPLALVAAVLFLTLGRYPLPAQSAPNL